MDLEIAHDDGFGSGLGPPLGATGARIQVRLQSERKRRCAISGPAGLCVGVAWEMPWFSHRNDPFQGALSVCLTKAE